MKHFSFLLILLISLGLMGCDQVGSMNLFGSSQPYEQPEEFTKSSQFVDDINLAKVLVKTKAHEIQVTKDPFKPIIAREEEGSNENLAVNKPLQLINEEVIKDLSFLGVMKIDNRYSALILSEEGKKVYQVNDNIKGFQIMEIQPEQITIRKDNIDYQLKRGEQ